MVPGNHESKRQLDILENNYNVHLLGNAPVKITDDLALFGSNYVPIGPYGVHEEDIFENLKNNFDAVKDFKFRIMLNHLPPHNTTIGDMSPFAIIEGSHGVRNFIDNFNPEIALCGHIHESSGLEEIVNKTKVINVGRTFKVFEFDTEKKELKVIEE
ncbi:MAG: metallophosphoesterase, partial [Nanoarchaeota archaeon]|nr:metallophosphoesterase [Nanoarchaeota archaeon]